MQGLLRLGRLGRGGDRGAAACRDRREFRQRTASGCRPPLRRSTEARAAEAAKAEAAQAAQLARLAANEGETRRLIEIVRSLAGDRERLLARLAALERNLEDVTGSIQKQAAHRRPPHRRATAAAAAEPPPKTAAVPPQTVAAEPSPRRLRRRPSHRTGRAICRQPAGSIPELEAIQARPAAGVDVGGATRFRWAAHALERDHAPTHSTCSKGCTRSWRCARTASRAPPSSGWSPDRSPTSKRPARICATLAAAKRYCRLAPFEGQPLALHVPEPPRRRRPPRRRPIGTRRTLSADCPAARRPA